MKKFIFGLSCLAIIFICTLNIKSSLSMSNQFGYSSLTDLISLNTASAEEGDEKCKGFTCDDAGGQSQTTGVDSSGKVYCCGSSSPMSGNKEI